MKKDTDIQTVEIFAGTSFQAGMLKSRLESENIHAYLKDEFMGTAFPWYTSPGGAGAVKVIESSKDELQAKAIVAAFDWN
jgi:hypothetical protein